MRSTRFVSLSLAFLVGLSTACVTDGADTPVVVAGQLDRLDASDETLAETGVVAWRRAQRGDALVVEALDADEQVIATIELDQRGLRITAPGQPVRVIPEDDAAPAAIAADPIARGYLRDSDAIAQPEVLPPLEGAAPADDGEVGVAAALSPGQRAEKRQMMKCVARAADAAYQANPGNFCGWTLVPGESTRDMKVWTGSYTRLGGLVRGTQIVVSFKGTNVTSFRDIWADISSATWTQKRNPLGGGYVYPTAARVASGFQNRWLEQAAANGNAVRNRIAAAATQAARPVLGVFTPMEVIVTGHSLGGAVATIAGYDVATYVRDRGVGRSRTTTYVYPFNPPRTGNGAWATDFQNAMAGARDLNLVLRQFTRSHDPFQSTPPFMQHPVWLTQPGQRGRFGYCPQLNAPGRNIPGFIVPANFTLPWLIFNFGRFLTLVQWNHMGVNKWYGPGGSIDGMADTHVDCMFETRP